MSDEERGGPRYPRIEAISDCPICHKQRVCRELLVEGGGKRWFAMCATVGCPLGPTILRSIEVHEP